MSALANPRDLFLLQLGELLWIERILEFEALPSLRDEAGDDELKQAFAEHLEQTREHVARVEQAFRSAGAEPASALSEPLEALKAQHARQQGDVKEATLRDLFHAGAAARTEHLELAVYEALIGLAAELGLGDAAELLERSRREEEHALARLEQIAARLRGELPR